MERVQGVSGRCRKSWSTVIVMRCCSRSRRLVERVTQDAGHTSIEGLTARVLVFTIMLNIFLFFPYLSTFLYSVSDEVAFRIFRGAFFNDLKDFIFFLHLRNIYLRYFLDPNCVQPLTSLHHLYPMNQGFLK